jgi:hypothetical protein
LLVLRERIALLTFGDGTRLTKAEYINAMPYIRLDSFTIEPNADIKVWHRRSPPCCTA